MHTSRVQALRNSWRGKIMGTGVGLLQSLCWRGRRKQHCQEAALPPKGSAERGEDQQANDGIRFAH